MATLARVDAISDRTLSRLVKWGVVALVVLVATFGVIYYLGRHVNTGPTLADRQVASAEQALRDAPKNVQTRLRLAATYQAVGRLDDAMAQYDEVLRAVPGNRTALLAKGQLVLNAGDAAQAKTLFTKITTDGSKEEFSLADPNLGAAHYFLAKIAGDSSDWKTALTEIKAALAVDRTDADSLFLQGQLQGKAGDEAGAVASYAAALSFVPTGWCEPYQAMQASYTSLGKSAFAEYAGAMAAFCQKDPEGATQRLTALADGDAKLPAMLGLALIAETQSQRDQAVGWYQKVLKVDPRNSTALTGIGRLTGTDSDGHGASAAPTTQAKAS
ncbi:MAG: tetratricopeptide repeat protein [Candidatus Nanopelagicales bacterium]